MSCRLEKIHVWGACELVFWNDPSHCCHCSFWLQCGSCARRPFGVDDRCAGPNHARVRSMREGGVARRMEGWREIPSRQLRPGSVVRWLARSIDSRSSTSNSYIYLHQLDPMIQWIDSVNQSCMRNPVRHDPSRAPELEPQAVSHPWSSRLSCEPPSVPWARISHSTKWLSNPVCHARSFYKMSQRPCTL
jgi:hypothetical protein